MKILVGKTKDEILGKFYHDLKIADAGIGSNGKWHQLIDYLENPKMHLTMRWEHWILVWTIPLLLIGLSSLVAIIWEMSEGGFPWIFDSFIGFKAKFINMMQAVVMLGSCLFMVVFPWFKWSYHYDWGW